MAGRLRQLGQPHGRQPRYDQEENEEDKEEENLSWARIRSATWEGESLHDMKKGPHLHKLQVKHLQVIGRCRLQLNLFVERGDGRP